MDASFVLLLVSAALVVLGVAGLVLPALPGAPLLLGGLLMAAWAENFNFVGVGTIVLLAMIAALTYAADFWATMFGAKKFGASKRALIGAMIGAIGGVFFGFPGVIFGPFIGAVIGELSAQRGLQQAARAGFGATLGLVIGVAVKLALAFGMIGIFAVARFF